MKRTTERADVTRRGGMRRGAGRARLALVHAAAIVTLAACGGSTASGVVDTPPVDTSTLVGTWRGSLDGGSQPNSYGPSNITMILRVDSTFVGTADNPLYCDLIDTAWRVSGDRFTATGRDCNNIVVTFASRVAPLRLTGTWTATSGRGGSFTIAKQ